MRGASHFLSLLTVLGSVTTLPSRASDCPQLLGPTRDAVYSGPPLLEKWPANGPAVVWSRAVGEGYSNPVLVGDRLVFCHRLDTNLIVECLESKTGKPQWKFTHGMKFQDGAYFDSGPRPTP